MDNNRHVRLSKFISLLLRHKPEILSLLIDEDGFVKLRDLVRKIRKIKGFRWVTESDIINLVKNDEKGRFELKTINNELYIRAIYGHSAKLQVNIKYEEAKPEEVSTLYHGTNSKVLPWILREGLKPMARKFVHLSKDLNDAIITAKRRKGKTVILEIKARDFLAAGGKIWKANERIYLAREIPPEFIRIYKYGIEEK
ncbi:MAG: RNA 2'-phosphotransferase [Candidatus Njordarchaeum guaymaensis]